MKKHLVLPFLLTCAALQTSACHAALNPSAIIGEVAQATLSPDQTRVAYARRTPQGWRIFVSHTDGSAPKMISNGPKDDIEPSWRPDGALIAFASNRTGNFDLWAVRPDGTTPRALTKTVTDERYPQWSPRPFGLLRPGEIAPRTVVNRSKSNLAPSDLQLLTKLAKNSTDWDLYSYKFNIKPIARYYKLLFVEGKGDARRIATMRESGSLRRTLDSGMPGAHFNPCWERTGATIAFARKTATGDAIYLADHPNTFDQNQGEGQVKLGIDLKEWRASIKRVGIAAARSPQLSWTPNGEYIAAATGRELRLWPRPGSGMAPIVARLPANAAPFGFDWGRDARTAVLTLYAGQKTVLRAIAVNNPLLNVVNIRDFADSLQSRDRALLATNSFVAAGKPRRQMFHVYEETDYENLPVFVTSDSVLHLNHLVFDFLLREVEKHRLTPEVIALTEHYWRASLAQMRHPSPVVREAATRNAAFFAVAARLALGAVKTGEMVEPTPVSDDPLAADQAAARARTLRFTNELLQRWTAPLQTLWNETPPEVRRLAESELELIRGHSGLEQSPIFGGALTGVGQQNERLLDTRIDYSDFIPRGHYTRSEILRRYFLMSRWLAAGPFRPNVDGTRRALLILAATDNEQRARLDKVLKLVGVFVGEADDADVPSYAILARQQFGALPKPDDLVQNAAIEGFLKHVAALPPPRIAPSRGPAFRFLPQPYTPDAEIMQSLVYDRNPPDVGTEDMPRYFALGLDVMGVLGSQRARQILDSTKFQSQFFNFDLTETQYANYETQFQAQRAHYAAWKDADWQRNLYTRTLHALLPLLQGKGNPNYRFTQNTAWTDKNLNTALATWAELKHDTLPKQPVAIEAGGEGGISEVPLWESPRGFVEPAPEVLRRLSDLAAAERAALQSVDYLPPEIAERLDAYQALLSMLANLEKKQSAGTSLTPREVEQLRFFGAYQEHLTLVTAEGEAGSMEGNDMAIIADVASAFSTRQNRLLVLEEGVGRAIPLYVAVERDGRRELARGSAFTYYEFAHPAEDRLTDEKWRDLLDSPNAPALPTWTKSFVSRLED